MTKEEFIACLRAVVPYPKLCVDVYRISSGEWWVHVSSGKSHLKSYAAAVDTQEEALAETFPHFVRALRTYGRVGD